MSCDSDSDSPRGAVLCYILKEPLNILINLLFKEVTFNEKLNGLFFTFLILKKLWNDKKIKLKTCNLN